MKYRLCLSAHVTICEVVTYDIEADNASAAIKEAGQRFNNDMQTKHSWCDYDEVNIDHVTELSNIKEDN